MAYFDHNATTPPTEAALAAFASAQAEGWRNPSSPTREAARVRARLEGVRVRFSELFAVEPESLVFTSGATEANNAVFAHLARECPGCRVLLSPVEHPSVQEAAELHFPGNVEFLGGDTEGVVSPKALGEVLAVEPPALVSVMAANNETGVLQPWSALAAVCREHGTLFHCDATQWVGKLPLEGLGSCDFFTASAHKFGGVKGVGLLKTPPDLRFLVGGEQETGRRAGTENYPGVAAMLAALEDALAALPLSSDGRDVFEKTLPAVLPGLRFLGAEAPRLPHVSALVMPTFDNLRWVGKLEKLGHETSTGSACASGKVGVSPAALASGLSKEEAGRVVRVSGSRLTSFRDWNDLSRAFLQAHDELGSSSGSEGSEILSV